MPTLTQQWNETRGVVSIKQPAVPSSPVIHGALDILLDYRSKLAILFELNKVTTGSVNYSKYFSPSSFRNAGSFTRVVVARAPSSDATQKYFDGLVADWQSKTGRFSVIARRYEHQSYKSILDMKEDAIPLILKELRRNPDRWFAALQELTHENPAQDAENFYEAVDLWVAWGIENDYPM